MKDDKNFHELVRVRAHLLWEQEGRPEGKAEEHWRRAASLVASERDAGPAPTNLAQTEIEREDTGARRLKTPSSARKTTTAGKTATTGEAAAVSKTGSAQPAKPALVPTETKGRRTLKPAP